jgi:hypothetical protein
MLENIRTRWQKARAASLREEFLDASRRMNSFTEENAEHFARTLDYAFRYWITEHGPVKECSIEFGTSAVKELQSQAKQRYNSDIEPDMDWLYFLFTSRRRSCRARTAALFMI